MSSLSFNSLTNSTSLSITQIDFSVQIYKLFLRWKPSLIARRLWTLHAKLKYAPCCYFICCLACYIMLAHTLVVLVSKLWAHLKCTLIHFIYKLIFTSGLLSCYFDYRAASCMLHGIFDKNLSRCKTFVVYLDCQPLIVYFKAISDEITLLFYEQVICEGSNIFELLFILRQTLCLRKGNSVA